MVNEFNDMNDAANWRKLKAAMPKGGWFRVTNTGVEWSSRPVTLGPGTGDWRQSIEEALEAKLG